ncbi:MAG: hypothetical protein JW958_13075 [Candidatus Eisenbacteria bacterium]|nr:hypothetical protein [Candidatus Eisenbacteria bacterium]
MRGRHTAIGITGIALIGFLAAAPAARAELRTGPIGMEGFCGSGFEPGGVAVGDWNGDGAADVAASYPKYGVVVLCLGDGEGAFTRAGDIALEHGVTRLEFGRLGGADGAPPEPFLAALNPSLGRIDLLFPGEEGSLAVRFPSFPTGDDPVDIAVGYLDKEERTPFVAAANQQSQDATLIVWRDGAFHRETIDLREPGRPEPRPSAIAAGDLDGDGRRDDLAVTAQKYDLVVTVIGDDEGRMERRYQEVRTGRAPNAIAIGWLGEERTPYFVVTSGLKGGALFFRRDPESRFGFRRFAAVDGGRRPVAADVLSAGETGASYFLMVERGAERWVAHLVDWAGEVRVLEQMRDVDPRLHDARLGCFRGVDQPFLVVAGEKLLLFPLFVLDDRRMY